MNLTGLSVETKLKSKEIHVYRNVGFFVTVATFDFFVHSKIILGILYFEDVSADLRTHEVIIRQNNVATIRCVLTSLYCTVLYCTVLYCTYQPVAHVAAEHHHDAAHRRGHQQHHQSLRILVPTFSCSNIYILIFFCSPPVTCTRHAPLPAQREGSSGGRGGRDGDPGLGNAHLGQVLLISCRVVEHYLVLPGPGGSRGAPPAARSLGSGAKRTSSVRNSTRAGNEPSQRFHNHGEGEAQVGSFNKEKALW